MYPYFVDIAVIRPDFHYICFRGIYTTNSEEDAKKYFNWMHKFLQCHCIVRLFQEGEVDVRKEINRPKDCSYCVPPERNVA